MDFNFFESLFLAFGLIFIMEFGDKTQLTSFALTVKYRNRKKVFFGVSGGLITVTSIAVIIGYIVKKTIQFSYIQPLIGLLFFFFGGLILLSIFGKKSSKKKQFIFCPVSLEKCSIKIEERKEICSDANNCKIFINKGEMTLSYSSISYLNTVGTPPDILEIYELLAIIQKVFPNIFITLNRAEQFNSVHDRSVSYRGRKTLEKANNRLLSWILIKYYQKGLKYFLVRNPIKIPISILQKSYHLQFNSITFK